MQLRQKRKRSLATISTGSNKKTSSRVAMDEKEDLPSPVCLVENAPYEIFIDFSEKGGMFIEAELELWSTRNCAVLEAIKTMMDICDGTEKLGTRIEPLMDKRNGRKCRFKIYRPPNCLVMWLTEHAGKQFPYTDEEFVTKHVKHSRLYQVADEDRLMEYCNKMGFNNVLVDLVDTRSGLLESITCRLIGIPNQQRREALGNETRNALIILANHIRSMRTERFIFGGEDQ